MQSETVIDVPSNDVPTHNSNTKDIKRTREMDLEKTGGLYKYEYYHMFGGLPHLSHHLIESEEVPKQNWLIEYFRKWRGIPGKRNPASRYKLINNIISFIGVFLGLVVNAVIHRYAFQFTHVQFISLVKIWGSASITLYSEFHTPYAQPRNLFLGSLQSCIIAIALNNAISVTGIRKWLEPWATALAVAMSVVAMQHNRNVAPPGGKINLRIFILIITLLATIALTGIITEVCTLFLT